MSEHSDEMLRVLETTQKELSESIERSRELVQNAKRQLSELNEEIGKVQADA